MYNIWFANAIDKTDFQVTVERSRLIDKIDTLLDNGASIYSIDYSNSKEEGFFL